MISNNIYAIKDDIKLVAPEKVSSEAKSVNFPFELEKEVKRLRREQEYQREEERYRKYLEERGLGDEREFHHN